MEERIYRETSVIECEGAIVYQNSVQSNEEKVDGWLNATLFTLCTNDK